jgi:hypothetical protein
MMRELRDVLKEGFAAHSGALAELGIVDALTARAVASARRRRTWRAMATGGVSVAAVTALAVAAVAVGTSGGGTSPAMPGVVDDPNSLGSCSSFIPANGAVLPDGMYEGRAYVDPAAGFVVAVMPDGTVTRVQPGPNGDYSFDFGHGAQALMVGAGYPLVVDYVGNGAGGDVWVDSNPVGWGWTAEPLAPAPEGVDVTSLYATFAMTFGFVGQGYDPGAIPEGAIAEVVARYADGREVSGALVRDLPAPGRDEIDFTGLQSVALRVTLADGKTWEIRADYDQASIPALPCQPTPPSGALTSSTPAGVAPASEGTGVSEAPDGGEQVDYGDPLSGPESAVFQCGVPLPADLQDTADVQARLAKGDVSLDDYDLFNVGDDGLVVEGTGPAWTVATASLTAVPKVPGWSSSGIGQGDEQMLEHVTFVEVVALRDGVLVAAASEPVEDWTAGGVGGSTSTSLGIDEANSTEGFWNAFNGIHGLLEPCGATSGALTGTQLAVIYGFGPDIGHVTYGWTLVAD